MTPAPLRQPVPDDIREAAEAMARSLCDACHFMEGWGCYAGIAAAIMAERERCARVAEDEDGHFSHFGEDRNTRVAQTVCRDAAAAIRKGTA